MFIDSNHAGDKWTRRSRTTFMIYMKMSLINCYSKKQSTIETSAFGAESVAVNIDAEILHAIQYMLRIIGIPISGALYSSGDIMSVIHYTSKPESTLKKKSNVIAYHAIYEYVAVG